MSEQNALPRPVEPFVEFATLLRANGFSVAPEQTQNFIAAIGLLGPASMRHIHQAALATFAPPPERRDEFDALFQMLFLGQTVAAAAPGAPDEDELQAYDAGDGTQETLEGEETLESGATAAATERLAQRGFQSRDDLASLVHFRRNAPERLPKRRSRRRINARSGAQPNMRKALREAVKRDGEILQLPVRKRAQKPRRIVVLVDVSGSMKAETEGYLRFCHALIRSTPQCEAFTLGTRLTRISRALRLRNVDQALASTSSLVADWDGGTRLGDALQAYLDVPRFAGFARGALVIVLSDGLERGDHTTLVNAVERMSQLAWSIMWLTPLAADADYQPQTDAMRAVAPFVDHIGSGASVSALCDEVLGFTRRAA